MTMMMKIRYYLRMSALYVLIGMLMFITMLSRALDKLWAWCLRHKEKFAFYATIGLLSFLLFTCSYKRGYEAAERQIQASYLHDTVTVCKTVYDTITIERVVPKEIVRYRTKTDTLYVPSMDQHIKVEIPIDKYTFWQDSLYHIEAIGYDVALESVTVYPRTEYITKTIQIKEKRKRWGVGISTGYALSTGGLSPYVGIGLNYNLLRW